MRGCAIRGAILGAICGADMRGADIRGADICGAAMRGAGAKCGAAGRAAGAAAGRPPPPCGGCWALAVAEIPATSIAASSSVPFCRVIL